MQTCSALINMATIHFHGKLSKPKITTSCNDDADADVDDYDNDGNNYISRLLLSLNKMTTTISDL